MSIVFVSRVHNGRCFPPFFGDNFVTSSKWPGFATPATSIVSGSWVSMRWPVSYHYSCSLRPLLPMTPSLKWAVWRRRRMSSKSKKCGEGIVFDVVSGEIWHEVEASLVSLCDFQGLMNDVMMFVKNSFDQEYSQLHVDALMWCRRRTSSRKDL